ncbi:MAG: hypothetical protein ACYSUK_12680, partial [Planctomycetota bacterium]
MEKAVKKITSSVFLAIFIFIVPASICLSDDVLIIEDFESESYGQWTTEGEAFGKGPREDGMVGTL